jgi:DOPA 4,5-dioxygenase
VEAGKHDEVTFLNCRHVERRNTRHNADIVAFGRTKMPLDISAIKDFHAHVYYEPGVTEDVASHVRAGVAARFPEAILGRWHAVPVGPHTQAMYQIAFPVALFATLAPWLMLNREGLDVLLHPETGDHPTDHTAHAAWLGERLPLRMEAFTKPE